MFLDINIIIVHWLLLFLFKINKKNPFQIHSKESESNGKILKIQSTRKIFCFSQILSLNCMQENSFTDLKLLIYFYYVLVNIPKVKNIMIPYFFRHKSKKSHMSKRRWWWWRDDAENYGSISMWPSVFFEMKKIFEI